MTTSSRQLQYLSMVSYKICLDYDLVPRTFVERDRLFLMRRFKLPFEIWESSPGSYHIRCSKYVEKELAFKVLNASFCSEGYKELCHKRGDFPVRTSEKTIHSPQGTLVKPAPIQL